MLSSHCDDYEFLVRDETYLLRLCRDCKWRSIAKCCSILERLFEDSQENRVEKKPREDPALSVCAQKQFLARDQWENTPLHVACYHKPPPFVIEAILRAASKASAGPLELHTLVNENGATPLLICCRAGACRKTIQTLLQPAGVQINRGLGTTVYHYDNNGNTPFQALLDRYEMIRRIPAHRKHCLALEDIPVDDILQCRKDSEKENQLDSLAFDCSCGLKKSVKVGETYVVFSLFWRMILDLMDGAWAIHETAVLDELFPIPLNQGGRRCPLFYAAYVADGLPPKLTDFIFRIYGNQSAHDVQAKLKPLHLALIRNQRHAHPTILSNQAYFIQRLLAMDASAATSAIPARAPFSTRTSPFFQAIASGLLWHSPLNSNARKITGPLKTIFKHCPDVLLERDAATGLYPFMLAATVQSTNDEQEQPRYINRRETLQLDTIYNLLRSRPESIKL